MEERGMKKEASREGEGRSERERERLCFNSLGPIGPELVLPENGRSKAF